MGSPPTEPLPVWRSPTMLIRTLFLSCFKSFNPFLYPPPMLVSAYLGGKQRIGWVQHLTLQNNIYDVWFHHKRGQKMRQKIKPRKKALTGWGTHLKNIPPWHVCQEESLVRELLFLSPSFLLKWQSHSFHPRLILKLSLYVGTLILNILCVCCKSILIESKYCW